MTIQNTSREQGKSSRIRQIIAEFQARKAQGENPSEQELLASHPDLMPQLEEELAQSNQGESAEPAPAGNASGAAAPGESEQNDSITATFDSVATRAHKHATTVDSAGVTPRIGHYEILELLGEGGFGHVYLAKDVDLARPVAIKVAKPNQSPTSSGMSFLDEARRVAQLNHPSIVKILDISRGDIEAWYLVMEYVDGPSLLEVYREGNLSITGLIRLISQVADGVHHAHMNKILHRDLKPANVLLGKDGRPRIVDFGMALQAQEQPFAPRQASGTPYCMAPEQVRGETHRLDARTDLWSLGVLLYEGLTGKRPFSDKSVEQVFESILGKDPPPPSHVNPTIPPELDRICLKCMSKRMADRYESAADLSTELQQWLADSENRSSKDFAVDRKHAPAIETDQEVRVVPRGLRSFNSDDAGFFLNLLPGPRNRHGLPESVQFWKRAIENVEHRPELSVLVLYGPSGTGKSSFIKAGVLPRCANSFSTVVVDAATANLERELLISLHRVRPDLPVQIDLARACAAVRSGGPSGGAEKVLIVLDQFEQWLHANTVDEAEELIRALRHCDGIHLQCLLIVRSDFWVGITRFMRQLELPIVEGLNSAHLDLFDARHARKVLTLFGQSYGNLPPAPDEPSSEQQQFVEEAVAQVTRDGWIMPVRLALLAEMMKAQEWNVETLRKLGGERGIGVAYLEQVFASPLSAPNHRRYRKAAEGVLRALLPDAGVELKGRGRTQYELRQASGLADKSDRFNELIEILDSQLRLITPTEGATSHAVIADGFESSACVSTTLPTFQLTHDYLVPALREWLTREQQSTPQGRAQLLLEERDRLWQQEKQPRFLPSLPETLRISALTQRQDWTPSQRAMLKTSAAQHVKKSLVVLVAVLGLAALMYLWMPPDPLPIYLDSQQSAMARNNAFDRLDLSNVAALGPVLAALKIESNQRVFEHTVAGLETLARSLPTGNSIGGDSVHDLILSVVDELMRREPAGDGGDDDVLRSRLFEMYACLATPEETLEFIAEQFSQGYEIPAEALAEYLENLEDSGGFSIKSYGDKGDARREQLAVDLIELMDALPAGRVRTAAAELLDELSVPERVDLFTVAFAAEPSLLSRRSFEIYIDSKSTSGRADAAANHLSVIRDRIQEHLTAGQVEVDAFIYWLSNLTELQKYTVQRDDEVLALLAEIINRRDEFVEQSGLIDEACSAFAAVYRKSSPSPKSLSPSIQPLVDTLKDSTVEVETRASAAVALGAIGKENSADDLAEFAIDERTHDTLRLAAIGGLGEIGLQLMGRKESVSGVSEVFVELVSTETPKASDRMLGEVLKQFVLFAPVSEFPRFVELLQVSGKNIIAERAIYRMLMRFPDAAQEIVNQTLKQMAELNDDQLRTLSPSPDQMFGEITQVRAFQQEGRFVVTCRSLAEALANAAALNPNLEVRNLAQQNLEQLLVSFEMQLIDAKVDEEERKSQLTKWQHEWRAIHDKLTISADGQLEVRSEESP